MRKILTEEFFNRPALTVARELLGKYIVRTVPARGGRSRRQVALMITETEAYDGFKDKASHAHRGKTERNKIMFGHPGVWYVYFTYGMHWMLNIVVGKAGYPAAVLIRAAISAENLSTWKPNFQVKNKEINGPARLTKFLKIDKKLNNKTAGKKTGLWIEDRGEKIKNKNIKRTPRIGIRYAAEWAEKPYRFLLKDQPAKSAK